MKIKNLIQTAGMIAIFASSSAFALTIDPASTTFIDSGSQTSNAQIVNYINGTYGTTELYKQDVGGGESFALAGSYETSFANTPNDPADATITYEGGDIVAPTAYLLVKDGNQDPSWYLFDLTALGWNGIDTINAVNFWPAQGAISHVSLFGTNGSAPGQTVPETGATIALLGFALAGLGILKRRK